MSETKMEFGPFYSEESINSRIKEMKDQMIFSNPKKNFIIEDKGYVFLIKNKVNRVIEEYTFVKENV